MLTAGTWHQNAILRSCPTAAIWQTVGSHMADGRQEQQATRLGFLTSFCEQAGSWQGIEDPAGTQKAARMFLSRRL